MVMTGIAQITDGSLISAEKVHGTDVFNGKGEKLGSIEDIMIDKITGQVAYAILSFGGVLGVGEKQFPLPWSTLNYDSQRDGYLIDLDKDRLKNAPSFGADDNLSWTADYGRTIDKYYGAASPM
jgi:sporulation protein YlmC with PRC-barrel domain